MKFGIAIALASLSAVPAFAQDAVLAPTSPQPATQQLCGTISSFEFGPKCTPGEACPMWMALGYRLTTDTGQAHTLSADTEPVLTELGQDKGSFVCVDGAEVKGARASFDVARVTVGGTAQPELAAANPGLEAGSDNATSWNDGTTSLEIHGKSANITFLCGGVSIQDWHADGKPMQGENMGGPIEVGPHPSFPVVTVKAFPVDGKMHVSISGQGAYIFSPGPGGGEACQDLNAAVK